MPGNGSAALEKRAEFVDACADGHEAKIVPMSTDPPP